MKKISYAEALEMCVPQGKRLAVGDLYLQHLGAAYTEKYPDCTHAVISHARHPRWSDPWKFLVLQDEPSRNVVIVTNKKMKAAAHLGCYYREDGTHSCCTTGNVEAARKPNMKTVQLPTGFIFDTRYKFWRQPKKHENIYECQA